jgi:hypothetical protein
MPYKIGRAPFNPLSIKLSVMSDLIKFTDEFSEEDWKKAMSSKSKRLIEYVDEDPFYVLSEVFSFDQWTFITEELRDWLIIGLTSNSNEYFNWDKRLTLVVFYDNLVLLIEALYITYVGKIEDADKKENIQPYEIHFLSKDEKANPKPVMVRFFEKFTTDYIMRELDDWFTATLSYPGYWRSDVINSCHAQRIHENVLCLIKSAERLLSH